MGWLFAIVIVVLFVAYPAFRVIVGGLVALALVVGGGFFLYNRASEAAAISRVQPSDVAIEGATLGRSAYSDSSYQFQGRLRNNNRTHSVNRVALKITLRDCATNEKLKCDVVGENDANLFIVVPPTQVRDIDRSMFFSPAPVIRGVMSWDYELMSVWAD